MNWTPTPTQTRALQRSEFEILFGGARGGGKSACGMAWLLYDIQHPLYRGLVIRKNSDDLKDWIDRASQMYARCGAVFTGSPATIRFPSGAVIRTGHLKDDNAYTKYQGHEYHRILIEELTQIPREQNYMMLIASCRSTVPGLTPQIFATTNPGGAGHDWVKRRFIDPMEAGTPFFDPVSNRARIFISAKVDDNPYLMQNDPAYVRFLDSLPNGLKQAWRDGSWDDVDVEGAYFIKNMRQLQQDGHITVIPVEPVLKVDTYWDLGKNDTNAIWFAQSFGREVRFIDYYEDNDLGLKEYLLILKEKEKLGYSYGMFYFPHDMNVSEYTANQGVTRLDTFKRYAEELWGRRFVEGVDYILVPRMNTMNDGIDAVRLALPYCFFDKAKCAEGIRALNNYKREWDEKHGKYKDYPDHDWSSHATTAFMQFARTTKVLQAQKIRREMQPQTTYNPLTGERIVIARAGRRD